MQGEWGMTNGKYKEGVEGVEKEGGVGRKGKTEVETS